MKITIRTNPEILIEIEQDKAPAINPILSKSAPVPEKPVKKFGRGVRRCKKCGEPGHRSDHCPAEGGGTIKDKIRNLADEGLTTEEITDRLGVTVSVVNKYW